MTLSAALRCECLSALVPTWDLYPVTDTAYHYYLPR